MGVADGDGPDAGADAPERRLVQVDRQRLVAARRRRSAGEGAEDRRVVPAADRLGLAGCNPRAGRPRPGPAGGQGQQLLAHVAAGAAGASAGLLADLSEVVQRRAAAASPPGRPARHDARR